MHDKPRRDDVLGWMQRFLARARTRDVVIFLATSVLLVLAIFVVGHEIRQRLDALERGLAGLGAWGMLVFGALFVVATSLLVPESLLVIVAGALFGISKGLAVTVPASLLAASLQFLLARYFLKTRVERALAARPPLGAIQRAVRRDELHLQILIRLTPLSPATVSYLLGAAGVRFRGFVVACLGFIPHLLLELSFGYTGKHIARMAGRNVQTLSLPDLVAIGSLAATIAVVVVLSKMARKAVLDAVSETAVEPAAADQPAGLARAPQTSSVRHSLDGLSSLHYPTPPDRKGHR